MEYDQTLRAATMFHGMKKAKVEHKYNQEFGYWVLKIDAWNESGTPLEITIFDIEELEFIR